MTRHRAQTAAACCLVRWWLLPALLVVGAACAGCKVGPNYRPPETRLPDHWGSSVDSVATTRPADMPQWWTVFGDEVLNKLMARALQSNLDLKRAEARVREARAHRAMAAADLWPQVRIGGAYAYEGKSLNKRPHKHRDSLGDDLRDDITQNLGQTALDDSPELSDFAGDVLDDALSDALKRGRGSKSTPQARNLFEIGFDASWELDVFGGTRRQVEAAAADADASHEGCREVLVTLLSEVARNYTEARGYQQRIAITHQNIKAQEETLRLTRARSAGGTADDLDVARAQAQLSSTLSRLPALETALRHSVHQLSILLAEFPDSTLAELSADVPPPPAPPEIPLGLPSDLLRRRPDIRRRERQLAAATARIGVATADLFPKFSLNAALGLQAADLRRFLEGRSLTWSVGPSVNWKLLDGGRTRADIAAHQARLDEALAQYEQTVLIAVAEVEDALVALQNERLRYQYLADAVEADQRAVTLATAHFQEGALDFLSVVDAERSLYTVQEALAHSRTTTTLQAIAVFKALGGGWEEANNMTVTTRPDEAPGVSEQNVNSVKP